MAFALTLQLAPEDDARVRSLWEALDRAGVPSLAVHGHRRHRPHLTLVVAEGGDADVLAARATAAFAGKPALRLRYAGHGLFHGTRYVLHVPVTTSDSLRAAHHAAMDAVMQAGGACWPYYEPDLWVPHMTLAMDLLPWQAATGAAEVVRAGVPAEALAVQLDLVEVETGARAVLARLG